MMADTVTHGLYATVDQILARMKSVGLLEHVKVREAVELVRSGDTVPVTAEQFARDVFTIVTGSHAFAVEITRRLINIPGDTLFPFGEDGIVISTIGSGKFGDVHLVHLYGNQGHVGAHAVKVSNAKMSDDQERFQREIGIMSRQGGGNGNGNGNDVNSNHVLPAYAECGTCTIPDNGNAVVSRQYYAMEYLRGHTLLEVLKEVERTGIPIHPQIAMDLLVALLLKARNFRGHAHRDIKPENIMVLDDDGKTRLVDCGLSVGAPEEHRVTGSHVGGMGSPLYMAPEQFEEASKADKINDLYGIAATLYHLATGKPPVRGERLQIYMKHKNGENPDFMVAGASGQQQVSLHDTAPDLANALAKLLSKDRGGRVLGAHAENPDDAEIREIFNEWINHLGIHSSFNEQDLAQGDPGLFRGEPLPDSIEVPGGDIIGSRLTRAQIHTLLSKGSATVLEEGVVKAERGKQWKIVKIGSVLVLVVGVVITAIVGGVAKLTPSKPNDTVVNKKSDKTAGAVAPSASPQISKESHFSAYPDSEKQKWMESGNFSWLQVGTDENNTQLIFHNSDADAARSGNFGDVVVFRIMKEGQVAIAASYLGSKSNDAGHTYTGKSGSAVRSKVKDVGTVLGAMGIESVPNQTESQLVARAFGKDRKWVLVFVEGEAQSALFPAGRSTGESDAKRPMVFPTAEDCRRYLEEHSLLDAVLEPLETVKSPALKEKRSKPGFDEFGRQLLSGDEMKLCSEELQQSLETYFQRDASATTNRQTAQRP